MKSKNAILVILFLSIAIVDWSFAQKQSVAKVKKYTNKTKSLVLQCNESRQQASTLLTQSENLRKVSRYTEEGMKKVLERETALKKIDSTFATLLNSLKNVKMPPSKQTKLSVKTAMIELERLKNTD